MTGMGWRTSASQIKKWRDSIYPPKPKKGVLQILSGARLHQMQRRDLGRCI